jgi:hypothetical protein
MTLFGMQKAVDIVNDVKNQIQLCSYLDTQRSSLDYDASYNLFKFKIRLNRKKVMNGENYKSAIVFSDPTVSNPIWIGPYSLFKYSNKVYDLNKIVSESDNQITYDVPSNCVIKYVSKVDEFNYLIKTVLISEGFYNPTTLMEVVNNEFDVLRTNSTGSFDCIFQYHSFVPMISSTKNVTSGLKVGIN